ncbi:MAG TPA: peptide ABC transporter substrate-binding protein [Thermomicrobiales bacterium]|jgi:peptide/nickel transport system substrate-binding protein|nr:peptide ABC transporter substrate-binding protein [Thermomicrobiales bacterium]
MTTNQPRGRFATLTDQLYAGEITRRQFLAAGASLGIGLGMLGTVIRHAQSLGAAPHPQDAATPVPTAPAVGAEGKTRGQDGELKVLIWQAPTLLNAHLATGDKDNAAASLVTEPLFGYTLEQTLYPILAASIPSVENGDLAADFTSATMRLKPGLLWSDGTPVTANDLVFTHQWVTTAENNAVTSDTWGVIASIEAVDDVTATVTYSAPTLNWYVPFAGASAGLLPAHYIQAGGDMSNRPIGTGPFVVTEFSPNDLVIYDANPNYRVPEQPYFARVNMNGGGDPATAAQAVMQTGDWDFAWNVAVEPEVTNQYQSDDSPGVLRVLQSSSVERININFSDPRTPGPDGQLSWYEIPHPVLSDPAVRQAIALGIDRQLIVDRFYDPTGERPTANFLTGIPAVESPNTSWAYDPDQASQILDDAGWTRNGDTREKDGVRLQLNLVTTVNSVRQKTQQVVQANLREIGFTIDLVQVDGGIFFNNSPGNDQGNRKMYCDMNMFTSGPESPTPINYMLRFYAGEDRSNIAQAANGWTGENFIRYINPEFDAIIDRLRAGDVSGVDEVNQLLIQLNDIVYTDNAVIPLVNTGTKYAIHTSLIHGDRATGQDNVFSTASIANFVNIAAWNRSTPVDR